MLKYGNILTINYFIIIILLNINYKYIMINDLLYYMDHFLESFNVFFLYIIILYYIYIICYIYYLYYSNNHN